jgi:hypothetical protein
MENPNIKTKVVHSESKKVWNVIGTSLGRKYKIARIPYFIIKDNEVLTEIEKSEALRHAKFISECFNKSNSIMPLL